MNDETNGLTLTCGDQIGLLRKRCAEKGIHGIAEVADMFESLRQLQVSAGTWCYENYTAHGSNSKVSMRSHVTGIDKDCVVWSINHYFALNRNAEVVQAAVDALRTHGTGAGTSAMSGGHCDLHKELERRLAVLLEKEAAILFPTGYSANLGAISGLARVGKTAVLIDRECHASIIDGVKLGGAELIPFRHNNVDDLRKKLSFVEGKYDNTLVVVESVYSMSGDESPLEEIVALKKNTPFYLFVDEAHAFGIYSQGGRCRQLGLSRDVDFVMTTLSKTTASVGGVVATTRALMTLLMVESSAYMFQAAMTPPDTAAVLAALDVMARDRSLADALWEQVGRMRRELKLLGFDIGQGKGPIIPLYVRDSDVLMRMGRSLQELGVFTTAITFPVVKHSEVMFRFIVSTSHTPEQIDYTLAVLKKLGTEYGLIH